MHNFLGLYYIAQGSAAPKQGKTMFRGLDNLQGEDFQTLAGNTASGVYHEWPQSKFIIDIKDVVEVNRIERTEVKPWLLLHTRAAYSDSPNQAKSVVNKANIVLSQGVKLK